MKHMLYREDPNFALAHIFFTFYDNDINCIIRTAMLEDSFVLATQRQKTTSTKLCVRPKLIGVRFLSANLTICAGLSQMPETERVAFHVILPINWILNRFPRTDSDQRGAAQCANGGRDTNLIIVNIVCQLYRRERCLVGALCVFFSQNWWGSKGSRAVAPTGKAFAVWAAGGWVAKCLFQKGSSLKARLHPSLPQK